MRGVWNTRAHQTPALDPAAPDVIADWALTRSKELEKQHKMKTVRSPRSREGDTADRAQLCYFVFCSNHDFIDLFNKNFISPLVKMKRLLVVVQSILGRESYESGESIYL